MISEYVDADVVLESGGSWWESCVVDCPAAAAAVAEESKVSEGGNGSTDVGCICDPECIDDPL